MAPADSAASLDRFTWLSLSGCRLEVLSHTRGGIAAGPRCRVRTYSLRRPEASGAPLARDLSDVGEADAAVVVDVGADPTWKGVGLVPAAGDLADVGQADAAVEVNVGVWDRLLGRRPDRDEA